MERLKTETNRMGRAIWTHRTLYAGLAGAYGAGCLGLDKEIVQQIVTGLYVALVVRG